MSRFRVMARAVIEAHARRRCTIWCRSPVITEKATMVSEHNQVTFRVPLDADQARDQGGGRGPVQGQGRPRSTRIRVKGKMKRFRGRPGQRSDYKKAIVTLAEGSKIDVTTGV